MGTVVFNSSQKKFKIMRPCRYVDCTQHCSDLPHQRWICSDLRSRGWNRHCLRSWCIQGSRGPLFRRSGNGGTWIPLLPHRFRHKYRGYCRHRGGNTRLRGSYHSNDGLANLVVVSIDFMHFSEEKKVIMNGFGVIRGSPYVQIRYIVLCFFEKCSYLFCFIRMYQERIMHWTHTDVTDSVGHICVQKCSMHVSWLR